MKDLLKKFFEEQGFFVSFKNQVEPDGEVEMGEKVLGEMNEMEKCLYTLIQEKQSEHDDLVKKMESADEAGDNETLKMLLPEHAKNHRIGKLASTILWSSIESRFETSKEATRIGVRKGFKVVETFEDERPSISSMVIPGIGMMISIGG